jgi:hypothetical protein
MTHLSFALLCACLAACGLQGGCTAVAPAPPVAAAAALAPVAQQDAPSLAAQYAQYAQLPAAEGRVLRLRPEASQIRIHAFRAGRYAHLGHNHVLSAPAFEGFVYWPDKGLEAARFDLVFRLDELVFDLPEHRASLGPAFASPISEAAIAATRAHMLGPDNLQAERFPLVRLHSLEITGEAPKFATRLAVELHGQTRELRVPLTVTGLPQQLSASGALVLRQSDFGVRPYSVMGGLLAVQDDLVLEFTLVGE